MAKVVTLTDLFIEYVEEVPMSEIESKSRSDNRQDIVNDISRRFNKQLMEYLSEEGVTVRSIKTKVLVTNKD